MSDITHDPCPPLESAQNSNVKQGVDCINEMFDFFRFSRKSLDSTGTCVFRIKKGDTEHIRCIRLNPGHAAEVFHSYPKDGNVTVECSTTFEVFEGVYLNTVDVTSAVLTGKIRVKYFKYNTLRNFFNHFDLSSDKWAAYYDWKAQESKLLRASEKIVITQGHIRSIPESLETVLNTLVTTSLLLGVEDTHIAAHSHRNQDDTRLRDVFVLEPLVDRSPLEALTSKVMDLLGVSVIKEVPSLFREAETDEYYGVEDAKQYLSVAVPHLSSKQLAYFEENLISLLAATSDVRKQYHDNVQVRAQKKLEQEKLNRKTRTPALITQQLETFSDFAELPDTSENTHVSTPRVMTDSPIRSYSRLPYLDNLQCKNNLVTTTSFLEQKMNHVNTAVDHVTRAMYGTSVETHTPTAGLNNFILFDDMLSHNIVDIHIAPLKFKEAIGKLSSEEQCQDLQENPMFQCIKEQSDILSSTMKKLYMSNYTVNTATNEASHPSLRFLPDAKLAKAIKNTQTRVMNTVNDSIQDNCCNADFDDVRRSMFAQVNNYYNVVPPQKSITYQAFGKEEWVVPDPTRVSRTCNLALQQYKNHDLREMDLSQLVVKAALDATLEGEHLEYIPLEALHVKPPVVPTVMDQFVSGWNYAMSSSYNAMMSLMPALGTNEPSIVEPVVVPLALVTDNMEKNIDKKHNIELTKPMHITSSNPTIHNTTMTRQNNKNNVKNASFDFESISASFQRHSLTEMNALL